jgi:hypothetical protein
MVKKTKNQISNQIIGRGRSMSPEGRNQLAPKHLSRFGIRVQPTVFSSPTEIGNFDKIAPMTLFEELFANLP